VDPHSQLIAISAERSAECRHAKQFERKVIQVARQHNISVIYVAVRFFSVANVIILMIL
jgi:DNA integrity scanning protein DisA with diadenylate cyclase activity